MGQARGWPREGAQELMTGRKSRKERGVSWLSRYYPVRGALSGLEELQILMGCGVWQPRGAAGARQGSAAGRTSNLPQRRTDGSWRPGGGQSNRRSCRHLGVVGRGWCGGTFLIGGGVEGWPRQKRGRV